MTSSLDHSPSTPVRSDAVEAVDQRHTAVTKVLAIVGSGRCGSTLLERLLAAHSAVCSVGELHLLPHELADGGPHMACGCGAAVQACPFWDGVRGAVSPADIVELRRFREHHNAGRPLRPWVLARSIGPRRPSSAAVAHGTAVARVLRAVADRAEARGTRPEVIVDASKDPYHVLSLARSRSVDLRVVHLVRHPGGFVASTLPERPSQGPVRRLGNVARVAGAWDVVKVAASRLRSVVGPDRYQLVRYERLAADPEYELGAVLALAGLDPQPGMVDRLADVDTHALGGNQMRHDPGPIRVDERWRERLSPVDRAVVAAVTAPFRWERPRSGPRAHRDRRPEDAAS